ncbi:hypothetical protein [Gallaecimonas sp. GXIMD4217]|uniref:magnesium transporter MgtE N-terminal domain-containing protein n=1 Tax=Gallaecimonas sp. GXIMD4217 TaxID=3131927 RepID=UPI00311B0E90
MGLDDLELALAFLKSEPQAAARRLEALEPGQSCAFLCHCPVREGARVLALMQHGPAARLLVLLPDDLKALYLHQLSTTELVALLRQLPKRQGLLALLSSRRKAACQLLLQYEPDSVGAWMDSELAVVMADQQVAQALAALESQPSADRLYLCDRQHRLRGILAPGQLLGQAPERPLQALMSPPPAGLSARTPLNTAMASPLWQDHDCLPLYGSRGHLIGQLHHHELLKALGLGTATGQQRSPWLAQLGRAYGQSLLALARTFVSH